MEGYCVIPLRCGGSCVCSTLGIFSGGGDGSCGTDMLNMFTSFFSTVVCFYPIFEMGFGGAGFWRASARSAAVFVAISFR